MLDAGRSGLGREDGKMPPMFRHPGHHCTWRELLVVLAIGSTLLALLFAWGRSRYRR